MKPAPVQRVIEACSQANVVPVLMAEDTANMRPMVQRRNMIRELETKV